MIKGHLEFYGGAALFVAAFLVYVYLVRRTLWAIPVVIVLFGALALMTLAHTKLEYGRATKAHVKKVVLYTIGFNIAGSIFFALGSLIWKFMQ